MNLDEAKSEAILGARIRADNMASGAYVYYDFTGFRIQHCEGSSSGWHSTDVDERAEWHIIDAIEIQFAGRALRPCPEPLWAHKPKLDPNKGGW